MTISAAARVAPEEAVFRPALPPLSVPEFTGEQHMAKLTYSEQLKHPNWQKRRLEMLAAANWKCECCDASEKTLHVHHKRYVKGREIWEYSDSELQVMCETCHAEHHEAHKLLEEVLATADAWDPTSTALGLVAGYMAASYAVDFDLSERARLKSGPSFAIGVIAYVLGTSSVGEVLQALKGLTANAVTGPVLDGVIAQFEGRLNSADDEGNVE